MWYHVVMATLDITMRASGLELLGVAVGGGGINVKKGDTTCPEGAPGIMEPQNMLNIKKLSETLRLKKFWNSIFKLPSQSSVWKMFSEFFMLSKKTTTLPPPPPPSPTFSYQNFCYWKKILRALRGPPKGKGSQIF